MIKTNLASDILLLDTVNRKRIKIFHKLKLINNLIYFKSFENFFSRTTKDIIFTLFMMRQLLSVKKMKHVFISFLFICIIIHTYAQTTYSPRVRSQNTIFTIETVTLTTNETIVVVKVPNGKVEWVSFSSATVLIPTSEIDQGVLDNLRGTNLEGSAGYFLKQQIKKGFSEDGQLIRSLGGGGNVLDQKYDVNQRGANFYYIELHFDRIPIGCEDVYIRELIGDGGFEWMGVQINNPYPTVPNLGLSERSIKQRIDKDNDGIVGIYEDMDLSDNHTAYKLGCIKDGASYKLIYLDDNRHLNHWQIGDVKAVLHPSAVYGVFKADWYMADKTTNSNAYVMFEKEAIMTTVISGDKSSYLKMYPTASNSELSVSGMQEWSGTGFALNNGYVATNYHVIENAKSIYIRGIKGNFSIEYKATVVASDKDNDLALLKIKDSRFKGFGVIPYKVKATNSEVGQDVFVLGYPLKTTMGDEIKLTTGVISSKTGFKGSVASYQISAPVQPGNSGGGLFDGQGNLIGVVNAKYNGNGAENVSYAIKTSYLRNLVERAIPIYIWPNTNQVQGLTLTDKVKSIKNFVYMINCSNR